jgi:hypothetical protein
MIRPTAENTREVYAYAAALKQMAAICREAAANVDEPAAALLFHGLGQSLRATPGDLHQ